MGRCKKCGVETEALYKCPYCGEEFCSKHITPTIDEFSYGHKCIPYINRMQAMHRERPLPKIPRIPGREPKREEVDMEIRDLFKYSVLLIILLVIVVISLRVFKII